MTSSLPARDWSPYLYNHEIPVRLHIERLIRRTTDDFKTSLSHTYHILQYCVSNPHEGKRLASQYLRTRVLTARIVLILLWAWFLWQHEVTWFQRSIDACAWPSWEDWPADAEPHHLVFVADPQLVDPHTYPERPWPLSSLTILEADVYLRRGYSRIQHDLDPDTIFFLGDLFDGGREWSTHWSQSPEEQYRRYGDRFWMQEYRRFTRLFFNDHKPGQRIIASLPGNHDLGFSTGVQIPVRDRFNAMFGPSNRMDIIANHTFVSLDTVSLSARDEEGNYADVEDIWRPSWDFLEDAEATKAQLVESHLRTVAKADPPMAHRRVHVRQEANRFSAGLIKVPGKTTLSADYPTILLTHVPLYRSQGTPCGPLRERHPPSPPAPGQTEAPEYDERNALAIASGYQYQNVVSLDLTKHIVEKLGGAISYAFSGDDHDYCEVVHRAYPSPGRGIREITVKSLSFTMGVRRPGFLMVSLWNPVDALGARVESGGDATLQTHLCLMPDQLGIFISYAMLLAFSVGVLLIRAFLVIYVPSRFGRPEESELSLLPQYSRVGDAKKDEGRDQAGSDGSAHTTTTTTTTTSTPEGNQLLARSAQATRPRSTSPMPYGYGLGTASSFAASGPRVRAPSPERGKGSHAGYQNRRAPLKPLRMLQEWAWSIWRVAWVAVLWFLWLQRTY